MAKGWLLQVRVVPQEITCLWTIWICASAHFSRAVSLQAPCNYHFGVRTTAAFPRALTPSMLSEQLSAAHKQYQWQQKVDPLFHSARPSKVEYKFGCNTFSSSLSNTALLSPTLIVFNSNSRQKSCGIFWTGHNPSTTCTPRLHLITGVGKGFYNIIYLAQVEWLDCGSPL